MTRPLTADPDYAVFCRQKLQNPYPLFARLREQDPVHFCAPMHMWLVTRYDNVLAGLKDTERLPSGRRGMYTDPLREENRQRAMSLVDHIGHWLQNVNPPRRINGHAPKGPQIAPCVSPLPVGVLSYYSTLSDSRPAGGPRSPGAAASGRCGPEARSPGRPPASVKPDSRGIAVHEHRKTWN